MAGYTRVDTINNIADGNVINAADLDGEFDGIQAAFNSSTGHNHDGTAGEGAPILALGPAQDVTISTSVLGVKTTNTVDLGTSSLKFKDFYLAGAASVGGTLGITGATTLSAALTYGGVTLSNAVTGTGNMVLSASPTLTGTLGAAAATFSGAVALNGNTTIGDADTDTITQAASYVTGTQLKSAKTATNTLSLAAYDVDGTAYTDLITLTASNTPTLALTSTGVGTINNMSIGATTASTGAFTTLSATGVTTVQAGTAAAPAITTTGDTNTGIFFPAADTIAFSEGGVESMRIDSSGNVGIGVTSPATKLDVSGVASTNGSTRFLAKFADTSAVAQGNGGGILFRGVYTGTTLVDASGIQAYKVNATDNNYSYGLVFSTRANGGDLTANMRLDENGNMGLGVTPNAWNTGVKAIEGTSDFKVMGGLTFDSLSNAYLNTSNAWIYRATGPATFVRQTSGEFRFFNAPSGTAGNAISWTQAMTLDASGNLGLGTTSPAASMGTGLHIATASGDSLILQKSSGAAMQFRSDASTIRATIGGINGADGLTFATGAAQTERARIDSAGNMGINVTPAAWATSKAIQISPRASLFSYASTTTDVGNNLYFNGTDYKYLETAATTFYRQSGGVHSWFNAASGTAGNTISFTQAMTLDASGKLLVGTTASSDARLYVRGAGTTSATASFEASNSAGATRFYVQDDGTTRFFGSAGSETARIDSSGNLLVGTTSASSISGSGLKFLNDLDGAGDDRTAIVCASSTTAAPLTLYSTGASAYRFYVSANGTISATVTTITAIASDVRLKQDIVDYDKGLEEVLALQPRYFAYKNEPDKKLSGFIAQEVQTVIPEAIQPTLQDPEMFTYSIDWYPLLVKAIQEQQAIITQLQADVAALKNPT